MKTIIENFPFWHTFSKIFKKSTWWALGTQMCGRKDMEDPVGKFLKMSKNLKAKIEITDV